MRARMFAPAVALVAAVGIPFGSAGAAVHRVEDRVLIRRSVVAHREAFLLEVVATTRRAETRRTTPRPVEHHAPVASSGFPGECIARHESATSGLYTAQNPSSSASGKYQILNSSWGRYGGYVRAKDAPPAVQEAQALTLWARNPHAWNGTNCPGTG